LSKSSGKAFYFVGAGPGDAELVTVKGARLVSQADVVIYAGSLVNREILSHAREDCDIYNSASMTLEEVMEVVRKACFRGKTVVRLHSGDPSLYGAVREQMDCLEKEGIDYEIVPGVSSLGAAAATLKKEYTLPGVSQTVILTRVEGRTPVPEGEKLKELALHGATMAIFLSVQKISEVVEELSHGYAPHTPVAVVQKASWPQEKIIRGELGNIAEKVAEEGIDRSALILVGDFMGDDYQLSRLYHRSFSHGYRSAGDTPGTPGKEGGENTIDGRKQ